MKVIICFFLFVLPVISQTQQYLPPQPRALPGSVKQEYPPFPGSPQEEELSSGGIKEVERPQFSMIPQENVPSELVLPQERYSSFYGAMQRRFPLLRYPLERYDPLLDIFLRKYSPFLDSPPTRYTQIHPSFLEVRYPAYLRMPEEGGYPQFPLMSQGNRYPLFPREIQSNPLYSFYSSPWNLQYGYDVLSEKGKKVSTEGYLNSERSKESLTTERTEGNDYMLLTSLPSPKEEGDTKLSSVVTKPEETFTNKLQDSSTMLSTISSTNEGKTISEEGKIKNPRKQSLTQNTFTTVQKINNSSKSPNSLSRNKQQANQPLPNPFTVTMPSVKNMSEGSNSSSELQENFVLFTTEADDLQWIPPEIHNCWATGEDAGNLLKDQWCIRNCARGGICPANSNIHCHCIPTGFL